MSFTARATTSGTAPALAFTKSFAAAHPEFTEGRFEAHVIAPGKLLISASVQSDDDEDDPVLGAFLSFLDKQMLDHPDLIQPFTQADIEGLDVLLEGVDVDLGEEIDDDFVLP